MKNREGYLRDVKILADHLAYDYRLLPARPLIDYIRGSGLPPEVQPYVTELVHDYGVPEPLVTDHLCCALRRIVDEPVGEPDFRPDWALGDWWGETCPPGGRP